MERLRYLLAAVALAGFTASLAVHLAALGGVDETAAHPELWALHAGIFVVFLPLVFVSRRALGWRPSTRQLRAILPPWILVVGMLLLVYVMANFIFCIVALDDGSPAIVGGQTVLRDHGHVVRNITQAEYAAGRATNTRLFSGHWLFFYFLPFAYFGFARTFKPVEGGRPAATGFGRRKP